VAEIGRSPQSFTFGTEWTGDVIQGEIDGTTSGIIPRQELSEGTHGTHVAGIAAGLHGVAPDAGLILVQVPDLPWNPDLDVEVLEGAEYIFQKADELGRPCVINISLGDDRHYRDGADLMSQGLDELVAAHGGRVICAAAGNNAINPHHWGGFPAERDSIWTYVYGNSWHLRIPDSALSTLEFSVSVDSGYQETTTFLKRLPWRTVKEIRDVPGTIFDTVRDARGDVYAIVEMTAAAPPAGNTGVLIEVDAKEFNLCRIAVRGRGYFHMWTNDLVQPFVVQSSHWPINPRYRLPNSQFDISRPGVARNVITVGSSVNRVSYNDIDGNQRDIWPQSGAGDLSDFSGIGPTADGRVKPDITAPGDNVVSARSNHATADRPEIWGPDTTMMVMSGTSMASPAAAGAVALYLEKNPRATFGQVRDAIIATARRDAATASHGPLPNEYWGNGKLDIFAALTGLRSGVAVGAPALLPFMLR
jgi:subtilisin family serine protease